MIKKSIEIGNKRVSKTVVNNRKESSRLTAQFLATLDVDDYKVGRMKDLLSNMCVVLKYSNRVWTVEELAAYSHDTYFDEYTQDFVCYNYGVDKLYKIMGLLGFPKDYQGITCSQINTIKRQITTAWKGAKLQ